VLKVEQVGVDDNFFELGGNSLLIAQVHRRLRDELGASFALVELFKYSTVGALAQHLGSESGDHGARGRIADEAERRKAAQGHRQNAALAARARLRPPDRR
jgi:acyl carrier protein